MITYSQLFTVSQTFHEELQVKVLTLHSVFIVTDPPAYSIFFTDINNHIVQFNFWKVNTCFPHIHYTL